MPTGNSHYLPSGLWAPARTNITIGKLLFKSVRNFAFSILGLVAIWEVRTFQRNYTYPTFVGKTMTFRNYTIMDHEPASVEEIDRMKAEEKMRDNRFQSAK